MSAADLTGLIATATSYAQFHAEVHGAIPDADPGARALGAAAATLATRGSGPQPLAAWVAGRRAAPGIGFATALESLRRLKPPPPTVGTDNPIRSAELIDLTTAEVVAAWLAAGGEPGKRNLVAAARTFAHLLAGRHPGRTIEVRVPPAVAVQIGFGHGPTHTRGTPPNVIETDPATFVRLATGTLSWPDAVASGLVRASGDAADLSPALPLIPAGQASGSGGSASS